MPRYVTIKENKTFSRLYRKGNGRVRWNTSRENVHYQQNKT